MPDALSTLLDLAQSDQHDDIRALAVSMLAHYPADLVVRILQRIERFDSSRRVRTSASQVLAGFPRAGSGLHDLGVIPRR